jgi:hypothetical protein
MTLGLLIIRVIAGLTMAAHAGQKLFGWFEGPGRRGTAGMMQLGERVLDHRRRLRVPARHERDRSRDVALVASTLTMTVGRHHEQLPGRPVR